MTSDQSITEVAVGVLRRSDGYFLLAQRPTGKVYAGYWEFPGGKLEPGESLQAALARELDEELGLTINACRHWKTLDSIYPHARVRLFFCWITAWRGAPVGREGQAFVWQRPPVEVTPLLPATQIALDWFLEPRLKSDQAIRPPSLHAHRRL